MEKMGRWVIYYMEKMGREVIYYFGEEEREVIYYFGKVERDMGIAPFYNSWKNSVKRAKILDFAKILKF